MAPALMFMACRRDCVIPIQPRRGTTTPDARQRQIKKALSQVNGREPHMLKSRGFVFPKTNPTMAEACEASLLSMKPVNMQVVIHSDGADVHNDFFRAKEPLLPINEELSDLLGPIFEHGVRGNIVVEVIPSKTCEPFSVFNVPFERIEHNIKVPCGEGVAFSGVLGRVLAMWAGYRRLSLATGLSEPSDVTSSCRFDCETLSFLLDGPETLSAM